MTLVGGVEIFVERLIASLRNASQEMPGCSADWPVPEAEGHASPALVAFWSLKTSSY